MYQEISKTSKTTSSLFKLFINSSTRVDREEEKCGLTSTFFKTLTKIRFLNPYFFSRLSP